MRTDRNATRRDPIVQNPRPMYDTHCHLTFDAFAGRLPEVLQRARAAGVRGFVTVATTGPNARASLEVARTYPDVVCTAGMHPLYAGEPEDWAAVREVAGDPRCVAWGELGLDRHYPDPPRERQHAVLERQLAVIETALGAGLDKPVVVHCRKAFEPLIPILRATRIDPARFVFHCFTGDPDEARAVLDFGAWISFTGIVTYPNAKEVAAAARLVPEDRIMVETDAPFLAPIPHRGKFPNEPGWVTHVAAFLAGLRGIDPIDFEARLDANAERFFGLAGLIGKP